MLCRHLWDLVLQALMLTRTYLQPFLYHPLTLWDLLRLLRLLHLLHLLHLLCL
jgi:hypothetical protein